MDRVELRKKFRECDNKFRLELKEDSEIFNAEGGLKDIDAMKSSIEKLSNERRKILINYDVYKLLYEISGEIIEEECGNKWYEDIRINCNSNLVSYLMCLWHNCNCWECYEVEDWEVSRAELIEEIEEVFSERSEEVLEDIISILNIKVVE